MARAKQRSAQAESGPEGLERWSSAAFLLGGLAAALFVALGLKPGGALPVLLYRWGLLALSCLALLGLLAAIGWSLLRRPVLQRRRWIPLAVLAGTLWATSLPVPYPSSHEGHPSAVSFTLPLAAGSVLFAGERAEHDPLALDPARRFGVVFAGGAPGAEVRAPAGGRVLREEPLEERLAPLGLAGRRWFLAAGEREVLVLEGLDASALPAAGADVAAGDVVGRIAGERLGLFLVDGPDLDRCEGIPMRFSLPGRPPRQTLGVGPLPVAGASDEARR